MGQQNQTKIATGYNCMVRKRTNSVMNGFNNANKQEQQEVRIKNSLSGLPRICK